MSKQAMDWAARRWNFNHAHALVLRNLAYRHTPKDGCFPAQHRIASECDLSISTVKRCIRDFEGLGLLTVEHDGMLGGRSNRYVLNLKRFVTRPRGAKWKPWIQAETAKFQTTKRRPDESKAEFAARDLQRSVLFGARNDVDRA